MSPPRSASAEASTALSATALEARSAFIRARAASVLALAPLGVWTVVHLWNNLAAFRGAEAWQEAVTGYAHPVAEAVTGIVVLVPLALHVLWGLGRLWTTRPNNVRYPFYANLKYALQRLSAVGVLLFLGAHLWLALIRPRLTEGHAELFADLAHEMRFHMPTLVTYALGSLGVSYHLANGVQTACVSLGFVSSRRGLQRLEVTALALFGALLAMSWGAVYAIWAAGE